MGGGTKLIVEPTANEVTESYQKVVIRLAAARYQETEVATALRVSPSVATSCAGSFHFWAA